MSAIGTGIQLCDVTPRSPRGSNNLLGTGAKLRFVALTLYRVSGQANQKHLRGFIGDIGLSMKGKEKRGTQKERHT